MKPLAGPLWRVFPWNPSARAGEPFSPTFVQPGQSSGRFDLGDHPPVIYVAESPEHAVGEKLQKFRGRRLRPAHLREYGCVLAIVPVALSPQVVKAVADLTDPAKLHALGLRPDLIASRDRRQTQAVARRLYNEGVAGLHWWSAITGDWHATILFLDTKLVSPRDLQYGVPERLTTDHPAVAGCVKILGIEQPRE